MRRAASRSGGAQQWRAAVARKGDAQQRWPPAARARRRPLGEPSGEPTHRHAPPRRAVEVAPRASLRDSVPPLPSSRRRLSSATAAAPCACERVFETVGRENVTSAFGSYAYMFPAGGEWYSHPTRGECLDGHVVGDGSGCTWRLLETQRVVRAPCVYETIDQARAAPHARAAPRAVA